ncbi:MAG: hypothetical protein ACSW8G_00540 [Bacillota bacterium]
MRNVTELIAKYGTKILTVISSVVVFAMLAYSGFVLYDTIYTNRAAFSSWDLTQYRPSLEEEPPSFEDLQEINEDTCAWIIMPGTHIDYPVVQGKDDLEYAMKDIYGKNCLTGTIYLTVANSRDFTDSFNLLYGHYMENGAMFGDIEKYESNTYFYNHQDGYLITTEGLYDLHVFARLSADAYDKRIYSAGDRTSDEFPDFLYYVKSLAVQWDPNMDVEEATDSIKLYLKARDENIAENGEFVFSKMPEDAVEKGMQLIALSTCADADTNGRQILVATMKMRTEPLPEDLFDDTAPLKVWGHGEADHWALLNLICLIMILALLLPGRRIRSKYRGFTDNVRQALRTREGGQLTEDELRLIGILIQSVIAAFSLFWFIWTEDPLRPMVIVDRWTLAMIFLFALTWFVDVYTNRSKS